MLLFVDKLCNEILVSFIPPTVDLPRQHVINNFTCLQFFHVSEAKKQNVFSFPFYLCVNMNFFNEKKKRFQNKQLKK